MRSKIRVILKGWMLIVYIFCCKLAGKFFNKTVNEYHYNMIYAEYNNQVAAPNVKFTLQMQNKSTFLVQAITYLLFKKIKLLCTNDHVHNHDTKCRAQHPGCNPKVTGWVQMSVAECFKSCWIRITCPSLWVQIRALDFSCEEAIHLLAYRTSVVLLRCPLVPEIMHGRAHEDFLQQ